jgi:hypothetical protein
MNLPACRKQTFKSLDASGGCAGRSGLSLRLRERLLWFFCALPDI